MEDFSEIQNSVSKTTETFCYDRAGIGRSESLNNERNLENISNELKEILDKTGMNKPCLLVAHSRGWLIARYFTNKYPEFVRGLILIDPALPEHKWKKRTLRIQEEKIEFDKYYNSFCTDSSKYSATIRNEFKNTFTTDSVLLSNKNLPTNIPITIIASNQITKNKYSEEEIKSKVELLKAYLNTAPQLKLIFTNKSGHFIHDDEPKLVLNEIKIMLNKLKTPLSLQGNK